MIKNGSVTVTRRFEFVLRPHVYIHNMAWPCNIDSELTATCYNNYDSKSVYAVGLKQKLTCIRVFCSVILVQLFAFVFVDINVGANRR